MFRISSNETFYETGSRNEKTIVVSKVAQSFK